MVNERSFAETDRRPSIVGLLDFSLPLPMFLSFFFPLFFSRASPSREDAHRWPLLRYLVAYIDTSHRLPSGSPSGFLVAVRQSPTATAARLSALRLFPSEAGTPDGRTQRWSRVAFRTHRSREMLLPSKRRGGIVDDRDKAINDPRNPSFIKIVIDHRLNGVRSRSMRRDAGRSGTFHRSFRVTVVSSWRNGRSGVFARCSYPSLPWARGRYTGRSCGRERSSAPPTPTSQPVPFLPSSRGYRCLLEGIPAGILRRCSGKLWQIHLKLSRTHRASKHCHERFSV